VTEREHEVVAAMSRYGGSFVKGLAECFRTADPDNFNTLRTAFPDYWREYETMVDVIRSRLAKRDE